MNKMVIDIDEGMAWLACWLSGYLPCLTTEDIGLHLV